MVGTGVLRDAEFGAEEGRTDFRDQLLGSIGGIAKALAEIAGKAMPRRSPVGEFMDKGGEVPHAARHGIGAAEQAFIGHLDVVGRRTIESALAPVLDASVGIGDEAICGSNALDRPERLRWAPQSKAINLASVEDV